MRTDMERNQSRAFAGFRLLKMEKKNIVGKPLPESCSDRGFDVEHRADLNRLMTRVYNAQGLMLRDGMKLRRQGITYRCWEHGEMYANYHTHTVRCNHAEGTEREYIEQGLKQGLAILGFSDHSPQAFDHYVSSLRMRPEQLEDYVMTLRALKEEYAGRMEILIGLEAEYYPLYFERLLDLIQPYHLDYLILGQHFLGNESDGQMACPRPTDDERDLERYVKQTIEALETGKFSCFAHPDILHYTGDRKIYRKWFEKLCLRAKELNVPLEMNMLGYATGRHYPNPAFFQIVRDVGNQVILGCDAHNPERIADPDEVVRCMRFLQQCGIEKVIDHLELTAPTMI